MSAAFSYLLLLKLKAWMSMQRSQQRRSADADLRTMLTWWWIWYEVPEVSEWFANVCALWQECQHDKCKTRYSITSCHELSSDQKNSLMLQLLLDLWDQLTKEHWYSSGALLDSDVLWEKALYILSWDAAWWSLKRRGCQIDRVSKLEDFMPHHEWWSRRINEKTAYCQTCCRWMNSAKWDKID